MRPLPTWILVIAVIVVLQTVTARVSRFGPVIAPAFPGGRCLAGQIINVNGGTYFNT